MYVPRYLLSVDQRFAQLPQALRERSLVTRIPGPFGEIPVLLSHPSVGWHTPGEQPTSAPVCIWLPGRTSPKELDPGRYLRWVRAGVAACAVDLPHHGERFTPFSEKSESTLHIAWQAVQEVDAILAGLADPRFNGAFNTQMSALGGMSTGGMATLRRLCDQHPFRCACVEATTGDYSGIERNGFYDAEQAKLVEAARFVNHWPTPIPLLALHSESDQWVPIQSQRRFLDELRARYRELHADESLITFTTWPKTGAPYEHIGFGSVSNEAKNTQTEFLAKNLGVL